MKKTMFFMIALISTLAFAHAQESEKKGKGGGSASTSSELELDAVIKSINNSLTIAQAELKDVTLDEGSVTLQTTYSKSGGGGFKLFVKASKVWSKETSNSITYKYSKPEEKFFPETAEKDKLAAVIVEAAKQYKNSIAISGLEKDGFEIELSLSIKNVTSAGIEFELFGAGIDGSADFEKTVFHSITLNFK